MSALALEQSTCKVRCFQPSALPPSSCKPTIGGTKPARHQLNGPEAHGGAEDGWWMGGCPRRGRNRKHPGPISTVLGSGHPPKRTPLSLRAIGLFPVSTIRPPKAVGGNSEYRQQDTARALRRPRGVKSSPASWANVPPETETERQGERRCQRHVSLYPPTRP